MTPAEDDADRHDVATEDQKYRYTIEATDPDVGDKLTFSLDEAPDGMSIDPVTGVIEWTPTNDHVGENDVTVRVNDRNGLSDTLTFKVTVANINDPPEITSVAVTNATENQKYEYDVEATDPDSGDELEFSLNRKPDGMTIEATMGAIQWTPTNDDVGQHPVIVEVKDEDGLSDSQSFEVTVTNVNDSPEIISTAITTATENEEYNYNVEATDPDEGDADQLIFSLIGTPPAGMSINPSTGEIKWAPTNDDIGDHDVTVRVEDLQGLSDTQSFTIIVDQTNHPPQITSPPVIIATQGELYSYDVEATDPDEEDADQLTYSLIGLPPVGMTIDAEGLIEWTPNAYQVGIIDLVVQVEDPSGLLDIQTFTVTVENVNDPPEITSDPVTMAMDDVEYRYEVNVTDPDAGDILIFSLEESPSGMTIDTEGLIQWTPQDLQVGGYFYVTVLVEDTEALSDTQSFTVTVADGKYAVIVGASDYKNLFGDDDLNFCDEDANSWYYYLQNEGYMCWVYGDNTSFYPKYDGIASENVVRSAIQNIVDLADSSDRLAFVFSGHGGGDGDGNSFIALWDYNSGGGNGEYWDTEMVADFEGCTADQLFVFLDVCYSGGMNEVVDSDLHSINHVYMTTTCTGNEEAWGYEMVEGRENSAWTYHFLAWGLEGSGHANWDMATCYDQAFDEYHTYYYDNIIPIIGGDWWDVDQPMQFDTQSSTEFYL